MGLPGIPLVLTALLGGMALAQTFPSKYHTYAEGIAELQALEAANPTICFLDSVGYSNRDHLTIYQFKISDNVQTEEDEPAILFNGGVHADEVLGVEVVLNFCNDIVTRYAAGDTAVTRYVDNYEIFAIPFVNPEGHVVVEQGDTDWRKNKTDNNGNGLFDFHDGVDGNRNYDFGWNLDTDANGTTPESLEYKGPYPFSESEARALRDLGIKYKPIIAVDYHSPTYGLSEKVYYCWYWYASDGGHGMAPDEPSMYQIGRDFAASIINDRGDATYEARRALVNKGDFKTYFYGNFGTAAFVCEISDTTFQDTSLIDPICQHNLAGMYNLLYRAGFARLTGVVADSITGMPLEAEVEVQQATSVDIHPRYTRANTGRYDRLINPSTYTLIFRKTGYVTKTISGVVVTNAGPTVTNAALAPQNLPPDTPTLLSPPNTSAFNDSTALNFDWADAARATNYVIEIATNPGFTTYLEVDSSVTASTYRNATSLYNGTFYWRVTAHNAAGFSGRSAVWQFSISTGPLPPDTPTLLSPPNTSAFNDSTALNFNWADAARATDYVIEIVINPGFTTYLEVDSSVAASSYRNSASLYNGAFYWRVTAHNAAGFSGRSAVWQFGIIVNPPPSPPELLLPGDGFVSPSAFLDFDWSVPSGAQRYTILIDADTLFSPPLISDTTLLVSEYHNVDSLANGEYYWKVKACNANGWSAFSSVWTFTVAVDTGYTYLLGDVNHSGKANGIDVVYFVNFLKGGLPPPLEINGFYPEADANGDCQVNGIDVVYMVNYFKGGPPFIDGNCLR